MDHRAFLATLPADARARLTERSDRAGLVHLAAHLGVLILVGGLIARQVPFWGLLLPVQGVLIVFLFTLQHECLHKTPFASKRLNETVGYLAGFVNLLPLNWFRYFHLAHHRHTNIPGQDPELEQEKPATTRQWLLHVSGLPYWLSMLHVLARLAVGREAPSWLPNRNRPRAEREARTMLAIWVLALASLSQTSLLLWVWFLPALLGQPFLRLYLLAEHGDCPRVADMFRNTRTTYTLAIIRFLAWNMPYHTEHHVFPSVPFYRLPELHRRARQHLRVTSHGYARFTRDYLRRRSGGNRLPVP